MTHPSATKPQGATRRARDGERGQTIVLVLLAVGLVVVAFIGLSLDLPALYLHREMAQNASNAACTAAAEDAMANIQGNNLGHFTQGTNFDCATLSAAAPCKYAAINGYSGTGLVADAPSNAIQVTFPSAADCPSGATCPAPGVTPAPASLVPYPFIRVDITDRVNAPFMGLFTGKRTIDVRTYAVCGMGWVQSPVPIMVLAPSGDYTLMQGGSASIAIMGGPVRSIQVNSSSALGAWVTNIDLTHGAPDFTGSDMGVFGGPTAVPSGFHTAGSGAWRFPSSPFGDPFAMTNAPAQPAPPQIPSDLAGKCASIPCNIAYHDPVHGCPSSWGCVLYTAGYYASGIQIKDAVAVFDPGLYYVSGGLGLMSNSTVRPGKGTGDGSGGTVFYLTGGVQKCSGQTGSVCVGSNSGGTATDAFDTTQFTCPGGTPPDARIGMPATINGNVLMAPCTGTYGDPSGKTRGMLFFQDRASSNGGGWGGGGSFLLAGAIYFHHCNNQGTGANCGVPPNYYNASFSFQGNSGSTSYILGNIITDELMMGGSTNVVMALDPHASMSVVKASLFF